MAWATLSAETFARARAERRIVLIDGSAEWCHWCHVMDATTYSDPEVRKLLAARFLPVKVDIDARPDFEERYHDWGWPATVLMTPEAEEIGKYKGYMPPARFLEILQAASSTSARGERERAKTDRGAGAAADRGRARRRRDRDAADARRAVGREGGQLGATSRRCRSTGTTPGRSSARRMGSEIDRTRALFTLAQQRKIIDPVWGGICQYSTDGDWLHPHYEKLAAYQAGAIDNYATAFALTGDDQWLRTARLVRAFVDRFMTSPEGGFYATMDADLNAHDPEKPFVSGHEYYAKSDPERRALGIPRVDTNEYGRENGLVVAAFVTLGQSSHDATAIATAERAAARILDTHATRGGGITRAARDDARVLYLSDNAAFGFALARLYEATRASPYLDAAKSIAEFLVRDLADAGGGFFSSTPGPGCHRRPRRAPKALRGQRDGRAVPCAARAPGLHRHLPERHRPALAITTTHDAIEDRGRMVGDLLLAVEETRGLR